MSRALLRTMVVKSAVIACTAMTAAIPANATALTSVETNHSGPPERGFETNLLDQPEVVQALRRDLGFDRAAAAKKAAQETAAASEYFTFGAKIILGLLESVSGIRKTPGQIAGAGRRSTDVVAAPRGDHAQKG